MLNQAQIDLSRVDLNLLVVFDVVMKERHVGRAAKRLHLSPSAVSHSIGRLRRVFSDPLFLKTPKGVVATARAAQLAEPVAEILARVHDVLAIGDPFSPARSKRRFMIGAPDPVVSVIVPRFLAAVREAAPGVDLSVRNLLPMMVLGALDSKEIDLALAPIDDPPVRFYSRVLYDEDFVIAMRKGHPFRKVATLDRYCALQHVIVSVTGDPYGMIDRALESHGLARHVALVVPSFMLALVVISETDLLGAVPRSLMASHAARFGVIETEAPLALPKSPIRVLAPKVAMRDAGLAWLIDVLERSVTTRAHRRRSR